MSASSTSSLYRNSVVQGILLSQIFFKMFSLVAIYEAAGMLFIISLLFILPLYSLPATQSSNCQPKQENT